MLIKCSYDPNAVGAHSVRIKPMLLLRGRAQQHDDVNAADGLKQAVEPVFQRAELWLNRSVWPTNLLRRNALQKYGLSVTGDGNMIGSPGCLTCSWISRSTGSFGRYTLSI